MFSVLVFFTPWYTNDPDEYTKPSQILLILDQALQNVEESKERALGKNTAYDAIKLAGFYVDRIVATISY